MLSSWFICHYIQLEDYTHCWLIAPRFQNVLGQRLFHSVIQLNSDRGQFWEVSEVCSDCRRVLSVSFPRFLCTSWHTVRFLVLVLRSGIKPLPPAVEDQNLNQWTIREVPSFLVLIKWCLFYLPTTRISLFSRISLCMNFPTLFQRSQIPFERVSELSILMENFLVFFCQHRTSLLKVTWIKDAQGHSTLCLSSLRVEHLSC